MLPVVISSRPAIGRRDGCVLISGQPVLDDVLIELLGPEQARGRLSSDTFSILIEPSDSQLVKFIGLAFPSVKDSGVCLSVGYPTPKPRPVGDTPLAIPRPQV